VSAEETEMFVCRLCELQIDEIPADVVRIGNVYRFPDGSFHFLRKNYERSQPKQGGHNPHYEAPTEKEA
jgi:hypothetical protein